MRAPGGGEPVVQRQLRIGIGGDVEDREIVGDKRIGETAESDRDEDKLRLAGRARKRNPRPDCRAPRR